MVNKINIIESIYIYYMFNLFKTKYYIHHPIEIFIQQINPYEFIKHPVSLDTYDSKICPFGNLVGILIPIFIFISSYYRLINIRNIVWIIIFIFSLILNFNAFVYLIPVFILEVIKKKI